MASRVPARRSARWSGCLHVALVRVAERSSRPPLPYQRKRTCARNEPGAVSPWTRWVKTKPLLTRPGADFCQTPSFGALTAAKSLAGAMRASRTKRIHMRLVPAIAGIDPTNVAVRAVAARAAAGTPRA